MTLNKKLSFRLKDLLPDPEGGRMFIVMGIPEIQPQIPTSDLCPQTSDLRPPLSQIISLIGSCLTIGSKKIGLNSPMTSPG